jgi:hypothetical protein
LKNSGDKALVDKLHNRHSGGRASGSGKQRKKEILGAVIRKKINFEFGSNSSVVATSKR